MEVFYSRSFEGGLCTLDPEESGHCVRVLRHREGDEIFIGRDFGQTKSYGEAMATLIDSEVKRIIDECYASAKVVIEQHRDVLERCAAMLLEKEKIGQEEFEALFSGEEKSGITS